MPQLLQGVICIIDTFQKYAREEGDCWTLSLRQLKQLLLGEIGDSLEPFDILTARTNLNLLDRDSNETISFNEFILLIFDLLNVCYQDIQSFLNQEPKAESGAEEELSGDMEAYETSEDCKEAGLGQYEHRLAGIESPSLVNPIEKVSDTLTKGDSQDDLETPILLRSEAEHNHPKSQSQGEGDEQNQERKQVQATRGIGAPYEEKRPPKEFVKRACSQKDEKPVSDGQEVPREQGGANTRDEPSEQKGEQIMEIQRVHTEEKAQRTIESQKGTVRKEVGEHTETLGPSSQENHEKESETADLLTERTEEKPSETKKLSEYRHDVGTPGIQESLIQGREYETQDKLAKGDDSKVPEIEVLIDERKGKRKPENSEIVGQKESEKNNHMGTLTEQEPDGKEKQFEGLAGKGDIRKDFETPDIKSGDYQSHTGHEGPAASEEITVSEISEPEFPEDNRSASVAERTPKTEDAVQSLGPQDDQSGRKNERIAQTLDQPTKQYDGQKVENQKDKTLSETYNHPGDDESVSEPMDLPTQGNCQSQMDAQTQPGQEDNQNTQESPVLSDESKTPETEVPVDREDKENTTEDQEHLAEEKEKKSSVATTPATNEEFVSQPGSWESLKQKVTATSLKTEITDPTDDNNNERLSTVQPSEKDHRKDPEVHSPDAKEEESEGQEAPLEGQDPETKDLTLDSSPDSMNSVIREVENSQRPAEKVSEEYVENKKGDSSPGLSEKTERKSKDTEPCSSSRDEVNSTPKYENVEKTVAQPDLPAPEEYLSQNDISQVHGLELRVESKTSECPVLPNLLYDYRQESRHQVGDSETDEEYRNQQETLASKSQEYGQTKQEDQQEQKDANSKKF